MLFARSGPGAGYEQLHVLQDEAIGLRAIIAIHSTRRGPAFGGIRRAEYHDDEAALSDALELAEAMSLKCALAGLPAGGAKTVILQAPEIEDWAPVYRALGGAIERLGGSYVAGPDLGTGAEQLAVVREETSHVNPPRNDAGRSTATGVLAGLRAVWRALEGRIGSERCVAVQGLGSVGRVVVEALVQEGVRVVAADARASVAERAAELGVQIVTPDQILEMPCDVLVPCAKGHVFNRETVPRLRCKAVCGSANNQLADDEAATLLMRAGILHVPDIVVSAGAVIEGVLTVRSGDAEDVRRQVERSIARLETVTFEVLTQAKKERRPPIEVAREMGWASIRTPIPTPTS